MARRFSGSDWTGQVERWRLSQKTPVCGVFSVLALPALTRYLGAPVPWGVGGVGDALGRAQGRGLGCDLQGAGGLSYRRGQGGPGEQSGFQWGKPCPPFTCLKLIDLSLSYRLCFVLWCPLLSALAVRELCMVVALWSTPRGHGHLPSLTPGPPASHPPSTSLPSRPLQSL